MKTAEEWKREAWRLKGVSDNDIRCFQTDARVEPLAVLRAFVDECVDEPPENPPRCGWCKADLDGPCKPLCVRARAEALLADAPARAEPTALEVAEEDRPDYTKRIALDVVTAIECRWPHLDWDSDEAMRIICAMLPETMAASEAMWDDMSKKFEAIRPPGPSLLQQLREALGLQKGAGLRTTLELAISRLQPR